MSGEEISALVQLHSNYSATEANLWVMYTAAALACAGFGVSTNTLTSLKMAALASVGFLAFATGQFVMVREVIASRELILSAFTTDAGVSQQVVTLMQKVGEHGLTPSGAALTHAVVDACIVALIMFRPIGRLRASPIAR
jgi:hypothetical protein